MIRSGKINAGLVIIMMGAAPWAFAQDAPATSGAGAEGSVLVAACDAAAGHPRNTATEAPGVAFDEIDPPELLHTAGRR